MMVRKSKGLSERQINILNFLVKYIDENGRPPAQREIGDAARISSIASVQYNLEQLHWCEVISFVCVICK
jgi:repressor LexA